MGWDFLFVCLLGDLGGWFLVWVVFGFFFFNNFSIGTVKEIINFGLIMRLNLIFLQVLCFEASLILALKCVF